jgi:ribonucleotide reductase alpha subunit
LKKSLNQSKNTQHSTMKSKTLKKPKASKKPKATPELGTETAQGILLDIGRGETILLPQRKTLVGGLQIKHHFSKADIHPYDEIDWDLRDVLIMDFIKKKPSFARNGVEAPAHWSENSVKITASKYLFGSEPETPQYEDSLRHPFDRIANTYTIWGWANGYFETLADARAYNWELKAMLVKQMWAPNSPVWFNLGHWEQWRWNRPDLRPIYKSRGNHSFKAYEEGSELKVLDLDNNMERPQASACFLTEVEDSMESILHHQVVEGRVFASGSGAGCNISRLRSSYEPISGKGRSSGPLSFNKGWDRMAGAIKSGGRSRRAARMILMDSDHPNTPEFIELKNSQEDIAKIVLREHNSKVALKALVAERKISSPAEALVKKMIESMPMVNDKTYDGSMDGEIYGETVSDQNANHSISFLDDFWRAYWSNGEYSTRWVTDKNKIHETFPAKDYMRKIAESVWHNAEPGCHNNDWINLWNPVKAKGRIDTSNPCVTGDTLVSTKRGEVPIKKLVGTTPDVEGNDGEFHKVTRVIPTGVKPVFLLETLCGRKLKLTADHKVSTHNRGDVPAGELTKEDSIVTANGSFDCLKSFTPIGEDDVFDLTEPATNHFVANGIVVHNCSEYLFVNNTSCNLSAFNIYRFLTPEGDMDHQSLRIAARLAMIAADLNIEECGFPDPEIAKGTYSYRTTGIGYGNVGGLLMALGIPYDSDEGRYLAALTVSHLTAYCWQASQEMGESFGAYREHGATKKDLAEVLRLHDVCHKFLKDLPKTKDTEKAMTEVLANTKGELPHWGTLNAKSALAALNGSFEAPSNAWDKSWLKTAKSLAQVDPWEGINPEAPFRNSFVSLMQPGGCLNGNSLVLTSRGLRRIKRLGNPHGAQWQETDFSVQTDQGPKKAAKYYLNGRAHTRIVKTDRNSEIQGTENHQIKKLNPKTLEFEWIKLQEAKTGDHIPIRLGGMIGNPEVVFLAKLPARTPKDADGTRVPETMNEDLAEFLGLFMGDGSLHKKGVRIHCTNDDPDLPEYIKEKALSLFGIVAQIEPRDESEMTDVYVNSTSLSKWFTACGFQKHDKPKAKSKTPHIPDAILETNDPKIYGAFIRGLAEADGSIRTGDLPSISTHSKVFGQEVLTMMLALGIAGTMDSNQKSGISGKTLYRVRLRNHESLPKWKELCGFISIRKISRQNQRENWSLTRADIIPVDTAWLKKSKPQTRKNRNCYLGLYKGRVTKKIAKEIIKLEGQSELAQKLTFLLDYVFDTVKSNEDGGVISTYDISVPENLTYIANGFVSHNTVSAPMGIYDEGTTSIEPDYTLVKYKTLSGGGTMTMFNTLALKGLNFLGYSQWQVREAALEVAGINGLIAACEGNIQEAAAHLADVPKGSLEGPVRSAFSQFALPKDTSVLDIVVTLSEGRQTELPFTITNGSGNVEGIPWLPEHHQRVFDCAATLGGGKRSIAPAGHIRMLGAIQPFLSGSSSKTCNLAHTATVEDIIESFELSHKLGVKCIALYRADSKGISVYASDSPEATRWNAENMFRQMVEEAETGIEEIRKEASKPKRRKLPGRRDGTIVKFEIGGNMDGFLVVGLYPDGRCGEVFGRLGTGGSFGHGMFESFCKAFSVMLQWGVPLPNAIKSFRNTAFEPSGFTKVGTHEDAIDIKACKSVVDLMMRILEWLFPEENQYRLRNRSGENLESPDGTAYLDYSLEAQTAADEAHMESQGKKKESLSAAETCPSCGALAYIQDGKCKRCVACGHSGGGCGG